MSFAADKNDGDAVSYLDIKKQNEEEASLILSSHVSVIKIFI